MNILIKYDNKKLFELIKYYLESKHNYNIYFCNEDNLNFDMIISLNSKDIDKNTININCSKVILNNSEYFNLLIKDLLKNKFKPKRYRLNSFLFFVDFLTGLEMIILKGKKGEIYKLYPSKKDQMNDNKFLDLIKKMGHSTSVGDEGGFAPMINDNESALKLIVKAINLSGFKNGKDIVICLDVAANELIKNKHYSIHSKKYVNVDKTISEYLKLIRKYKIKSIEDPFGENDWSAWTKLLTQTKDKVQIVGDDLFVTNLERLKIGFLNVSANSILIKLNQIGTVTETLEVIKFAKLIGYKTIISHRSGDSEDTFIADFAVGTDSNQIKTGSLSRSERVSKYNQLLRIEHNLGKKSKMHNIN